MARPPLPLGSWGTITTERMPSGKYRALARFRETDGHTRRVTATGPRKSAATNALREVMAQRTETLGALLTAATRLKDLADQWLTGLEAEGRIEQTTINEYRRILTKHLLPRIGGLTLREATTGRLDRLLNSLRTVSVNIQRKAKVVLGAMLDVAVRRDAIPVNPVRGTSRVYTPKRETKALKASDLVEIRAAVTQWLNVDSPGPKSSSDMADIIDLMLATGCRIGEILALRWMDLDLDGDVPTLTVTGTIKTEKGKGTYRKASPKTDASVRTLALPAFAVDLLRERRTFATENSARCGLRHSQRNVAPGRQR